jgi:predicted amidohydrolase YtcJ
MTERRWTIAFAACMLSAQALAAGSPARILVNANILTMDASDRVAQALAIDGDKIVAVGSDAEVRRLAGPDTSIIDLDGRTVIPGLNDTHIHAIRGGQTFRQETYWYDAARLEDALARMKGTAAKRGVGTWVMVAGSWSPAQFTENRAPTVADLDRILPDNPGYVQYLYDYAIVNQKGLRALGFDKPGASMPGIRIEKDAQGRPTGKLVGDIASFSALVARITASADDEQRKSSLTDFFEALNARGVTGIVDAAGGGSGAAVYDPLFDLWRERKLTVRVSYRVSAQIPGNEAAWYSNATAYLPPQFGDGMLKFLGLGEILVFKANDATRLAPGFQIPQEAGDELYKVAMLAARRRYPLEIHAYTNDAARQILDVFERLNQTVDLRPLRWCISHISTGTPETFARMKKLGLCYSVQMGPYYEATTIADSNGETVAESTPPVRLAINEGLPIAGGTDSTRIGEYNTWRAIEYLVTGRAVGGSIQRRADFAVTRSQVLRFYTANAAWLTFDEDTRGTLEVGKVADLAVLDKPFLTMPADQIHTIRSLLTLVGGKVIWSEAPFGSVR